MKLQIQTSYPSVLLLHESVRGAAEQVEKKQLDLQGFRGDLKMLLQEVQKLDLILKNNHGLLICCCYDNRMY